MPAKRKRGDRRIEDALAALRRALDETGAAWMVIGGIATIARGVRRTTTDIVAVIDGDAITVPALAKALARQGLVPRIANANAFARENLVLLVRDAASEVDLDIALGHTAFEKDALEHPEIVSFGRTAVPMARAEDLVVFKAIAARPKDIDDAAALLVLYPRIDLARVRAKVRELAEAADEPALIEGLDAVIKIARATRRKR